MSTQKPVIFLTGATGYIGGTVLWRLFGTDEFTLRILVRDATKAEAFKTHFGIEAIVGSHADEDILEREVAGADYVISTANVDDLNAAKAILRGLKKRSEATGKPAVYIHTSGTGVLADNAAGEYATERVYDDAKVEDIESLDPKTQIHREVDIAVTQADLDGYARTYIILPSTIYGIEKNGFTDAGLQNVHSIQIPMLIRANLNRGQGGMVGKGSNLWPNVHIDDVADLYIVLLNKIRENADSVPHGREGYFFGASGEHKLYDICKVCAEVQYAIGKGKSPEPTTFTEEELQKYFHGPYLGSNSRCIPTRSRALGWTPTKSTQDFIASIPDEVKAVAAKGDNQEINMR